MSMAKKTRIMEILRFAVTGGVCFVVEFVLLVLLRDKAGLPTLVANAIAFTVSVVVNYLLCLVWVFQEARSGEKKRQLAFFLTSLVGLALNELVMLGLGMLFGEDRALFQVAGRDISMYMINKVIATILVMIWNYVSKKAVLTKRTDSE